MRPPTTVGWPFAVKVLGNAKAHLSVSLGTSSAVRPAAAADWNRELAGSAPQPFHAGPEVENAGVAAHVPGLLSTVFEPRKSATARFSAAESFAPCSFIRPDSSARWMFAVDMRCRAAGAGARVTAD